MTGNYPPNLHDFQANCEAGYNMIMAHAKAVLEFRKFNFKHSQIGIVHTTNTRTDFKRHTGIPHCSKKMRPVQK